MEKESYIKAKDFYNELISVNCTSCGYCMPCPVGVNIPVNFQVLNEYSMFNNINLILRYNMHLGDSKAVNCVECGKCEKLCPQQIKIIDRLKEVHSTLSNKTI